MADRLPKGLAPHRILSLALSEAGRWALAEKLALGAILLLAAYLRLAHLDYAQFRNDDIGLWEGAWHVAHNPEMLVRGQGSSLGIASGPVQAYLLLPAVPFDSLLAPYVIVALLNCWAVFLLWSFARTYYGPLVALLAAGLYAVNPWAVIFSRRLWSDDMTAPFVALLVGSLCALAGRGRRRDQILPFLWFALLAQIYVVAWVHLATLIAGLGLARRRLKPPWVLAGALLALALLAPYLLGEVLPNLGRLARLAGSDGSAAIWDASSVAYLFHLVSNEGYQAFANHLGAEFDTSTGWPRWLSGLSQAFLGIGLLAALGAALRRIGASPLDWSGPAAAAPYLLPALAVTVPALALLRHNPDSPVLVYYLLVGYPFHFLLVAWGLVTLPRWLQWATGRLRWPAARRAWSARVVTTTLAAAVSLQVALSLWLAGLFFAGLDRYWPEDDYGVPLAMTQRLGAELLTEAGPGTSLLVVGAEERDVVLARWLALEHPEIRSANAVRGLIVPSDPTVASVYLAELTDRTPAGRFFAEHLQPERTFTLPGTQIRYGIFRPPPDIREAALRRAAPDSRPARFGPWLTVEGSAIAPEVPADGSAYVTTRFRVHEPLPWSDGPAFAMRLEDALGRVHGGQNVPLGLIGPLEPGDQALAWFEARDAELPAGPFRAAVGLYLVEPGGYRVVSATSPDRPPEDAVRFGWTYHTPPEPPVAQMPLEHRFDSAIRLAGYDWELLETPTRQLVVTLHWRADAAPDRGYTAFVHLVDPAGNLIAQHDGPPAEGRWPTDLWRPGDLIVDRHTIELPAGATLDSARLRIGLYDPGNGERLGGPGTAADVPLGGSETGGTRQ